jgi:hypothetical protein
MTRLARLILLGGASLLVGCASLTPKDYGFRKVAIGGEVQYCAPREWVVPPVVPLEAADDPEFPLYQKFLNLPELDVVPEAGPPLHEVCITQAQWPGWLTIRTQWNRSWPITPGTASWLAAQRAAGP